MKRFFAVFSLTMALIVTGVVAYALWPSNEAKGDSARQKQAEAMKKLDGGVVPTTATPDGATGPGGAPTGETNPQTRATTTEPAVAAPPIQTSVTPANSLVHPRLGKPPTAGMLFDVDTGQILWARNADMKLPIASLTKMMTALLIAERHQPSDTVRISAHAPKVQGSRMGVLKAGQQVPLQTLFLGLLMVSGNDAAVALAEDDSGSIPSFVKLMNRKVAELGMHCTHYSGVAGLRDNDNYSCAADLATLARADLANPRIAAAAPLTKARPAFPNKKGHIELASNQYFAYVGIKGLPKAKVTGLKTGLTGKAGRCYVTTARLGDRHLGVVLLHSPSPFTQVPELMRRGFAFKG